MSPDTRKVFDLKPRMQRTLGQKTQALVAGMVEKLLQFDGIDRLYEGVPDRSTPRSFAEGVLSQLRIRHVVSAQDLLRIPREGALVAVANHPFGIADPLILLLVLSSVRPDVKIVTNRLLSSVPELHDMCIFVDPFGSKTAAVANAASLKEIIRWLRGGGAILFFPAGEVASVDFRKLKIVEPRWNEIVARIVRMTKSPVLPMFVKGTNSPLFHGAGLIHPRLRTALLPHELLNKRRKTFHVYVGNPIPFAKLSGFESDAVLIEHLRERTFLLRSRRPPRLNSIDAHRRRTIVLDPIGLPEPAAMVMKDIERLPDSQLLVKSGELEVWFATAQQIPHLLREIGRLREVTFRAAGEGSGKALDLDRFDQIYVHLFLWHREKHELIGAYRLGRTDDLLARYGRRGLYTTTLFRMRPSILKRLNPALELGRSFVRAEYQRSASALAMLWKGIGQYVIREPRYRLLFGPVSMSSEYQTVSHFLMVKFLREHSSLPEASKHVRARKAFRRKRVKGLDQRKLHLIAQDLDEISALIQDVETDGKGVPILLRQYLALGGKILGFNVDPAFSNVVDGLILVDLTQTDRRVLAHYLGRENARAFLSYHGVTD